MPRVRRGFKARRRRKKLMKQTRGYWGARSKLWTTAVEALHHAWLYQYRHRKERKREFRGLWNVRISAAARDNDWSYSKLIGGLKRAGVALNRKMLADIAATDPSGFKALVDISRKAISA
jgi:large subunit ribosomal protein L20